MAKILLVEDDTNLQEIYAARLTAEGYEVASATDGEAALATAIKEKPDLIVLDVMMPKISGFDVLDILRSTPETQNTKVVMMTALSQEQDRQRGIKMGANKYLVKSQVTLEDVINAIKEELGEEISRPSTDTENVATPSPTPIADTTQTTAAPKPANQKDTARSEAEIEQLLNNSSNSSTSNTQPAATPASATTQPQNDNSKQTTLEPPATPTEPQTQNQTVLPADNQDSQTQTVEPTSPPEQPSEQTNPPDLSSQATSDEDPEPVDPNQIAL